MVTANQKDMIVNFFANDYLTPTLNKVEKSIQLVGSAIQKLNNTRMTITDAVNQSFPQAKMVNMGDVVNKTLSNMDTQISKTKSSFKSLSQKLKENEGRFQGWAMSIMFAGMAMMRYTQQLWSFGTKVFQDVMHSVEGTTTGFDELNGSIKYLGFTVGQALEPLAAQLIPIVMAVAEWVQDNEKLVAGFVKWGFILGTIFFTVGQLVLGFNGLFTAVKNIGTIINSGVFSKLGAFLMTPAGAGVLALIALGAITWKALKETPEAVDSIKTSIDKIDLTPLKDSLGNLWTTLTGMSPTWEDLAWTIAWAVDQSIPYINAFMNKISAIINAVNTLIKAWILWKELIFLDPKERKDRWEDLKSSAKKVSDDIKDMFNNTFVETKWETPSAYKTRMLSQLVDENSKTPDIEEYNWRKDPYLANSEGFKGGGDTIIIQNANFQEFSADEIKRMYESYGGGVVYNPYKN